MAADSLSDLWYRVRDVRLALRSHVEMHRHSYRGQTWYVVQDRTTGRYFRFTPATYHFIGQLDGEQTLDQVWNRSVGDSEDVDVTKGDLIRLLSQLYRADLLRGDVMPNTDELLRRSRGLRERQKMQRWRSPIAIRIPLIDPERFLNASWPLMRHLFGWPGLALWVAAMVYGGTLVATHWTPLTSDVLGRVLSAENALLLLIIFPVVKTLHEFGHAYALKAIGGEVHEMGVILLVFVPIPYVDASSASASRHRGKRALVGAAGMFIELFVAVIALIIWVQSEPGLVQAVAYNVILVAGVSTIFFNANPLVKFDGYYILADLIEMPNLGGRAYQYLGYLYQRYILRLPDLVAPVNEPGERKWLFGYAIGSFVYRVVIISTIVWLLVDGFFIFGVLLAIWAVIMMAVLPLGKTMMFLFNSPKLHGKRIRAITVSGLILASVAGVLAVPVPFSTIAEGVVWVDRQSWVRNETEGFVTSVNAETDEEVEAGDLLLELSNIELDANLHRLMLFEEELAAQYAAARYVDRVQAGIIQQQIEDTGEKISDLESKKQALQIRSKKAGRFLPVGNDNIEGTFVAKGSLLGFIAEDQESIIRVVVGQSDIDLVRNRTNRIELRFIEDLSTVYTGEVVRQIPLATRELPSMALASQGGGDILLDPLSAPGTDPSALNPFFQFDIRVNGAAPRRTFGGRVMVRFSFGYEPLALQLYRPVRQTFLSKFG